MAENPSTPLARYLSNNGIRQSDFAARIGCTQPAVARYVNGLRIPDRDTMQRIFDATNGAVTPNDFFGIPAPASDAEA